jgi:hypothetical protein
LKLDLLSEQSQCFRVKRGRVTAGVRLGSKASTSAITLQHSGDGAATDSKHVGDVIKSAFARLISRDHLFSQIS